MEQDTRLLQFKAVFFTTIVGPNQVGRKAATLPFLIAASHYKNMLLKQRCSVGQLAKICKMREVKRARAVFCDAQVRHLKSCSDGVTEGLKV